MCVKILILCILFTQTSASFFDEFRGAMFSVENSFGKLLSDVVTDVRDTIGCTILAVKQVLALGGIFHESSEYDARCRGISDAPAYLQETNNNYAPTPPFVFTTPPVYIAPPPISDAHEKSLTEKLSEEIHESIKNVNQTMFQLIAKSDTHGKMENVTSSLLHESDRLTQVSDLLRRELNNISEDIKMELRKVEPDINNPNIQDIWSSIRALHNIELSHSNTPEATEVHHILNEVLSVLRGYNYQNDVKNEVNTNKTFIEIKNQFLKMEEAESQDLDMVEDIVKSDLNVTSYDDKLTSNDYPLTFKDVAKKIMDETSRTLQLEEEDFKAYEEVVVSTTEATTTTVKAEDKTEFDPMESPEYAAIFQLPAKDSHSRKQAAKEAQKLIEKSKETDAIMNSYFQKSADIGTSVFDDPDLFNFGK